jgi:hypothetical protein
MLFSHPLLYTFVHMHIMGTFFACFFLEFRLSRNARQEIFSFRPRSARDKGSNLTGFQTYLGINGVFLDTLFLVIIFCLGSKYDPHFPFLLLTIKLQWLTA